MRLPRRTEQCRLDYARAQGTPQHGFTRIAAQGDWQARKKDELRHPFLGEAVTLGLAPHIQAQLLARHLRGDLDGYPAFIWT